MQCALFIFSPFLNVIYLIFKLALDLIITATLKYQFYHPYSFLAQTAFLCIHITAFIMFYLFSQSNILYITIQQIHILFLFFSFILYSFSKQASFFYFILRFPRLFKLYIIAQMNPNNNQLKANINASVFKASYIGGFKNPESIKKSQIQKNSILQGDVEQIDDKTFRIMPNFAKPTENIVIYKQTGKCFIEQQSFFSCLSARRAYDFQLNNSKFYVRNSQKIMRFVDFNVIWANIQEKGHGLVITFQGSQSQMYVEVTGNNKAQQSEKLLKNLRNLIQQTDGRQHKLNYLASKSPLDFFKTQHVLCSQFQKCANSGDVVLFKSQHSAASVQRVFTDSEYDHVGVVLRNKKNEIFIYESTSDSGVGLTKWNQFVKYEWYTLIDKVCWRPLSINLNGSDIQTIERFVIKTLGKQFELNLDKLLTFKSALTRTTEEEEKKTYFCSELVARLYKQLGILNQQKSSTSYFPVDFSDRGSLKIVREGVKLNNQRLISFDRI